MLWSRLRAVWLGQARMVARPFSRIRTQASHESHGFLAGIVTLSDTEPLTSQAGVFLYRHCTLYVAAVPVTWCQTRKCWAMI